MSTTSKKRCAVYTRKSHEEGLEQEYNSLDAQRDAGQSYIASQRSEGWIPVVDQYDDPAYSGGNMERPALKRLLADIEGRKIDVVVVYKIDRLSRSLADFAKMVELFDQHQVTFVSVTQQFNTTTSMGRLTLNILLSFAQFEREVTGERIRDKIAASKKKGLFMGGVPPLGYDVAERKLVINDAEAGLVRQLFDRIAAHGSPARLVRELALEGHTTKAWTTRDGKQREGRVIDQQFLFKLLRNRVYLGEIVHKGVSYPGQHPAIIAQAQWDAVHALLDARKREKRAINPESTPALLSGLLYTSEGIRMIPTFTAKPNGKRYRYYVPYLDKRRCGSHTRLIPAAQIEALVLKEVQQSLKTPEMRIEVLRAMPDEDRMDEASVVVAIQHLGEIWDQLFPAEQQRIVRLAIERIELQENGLDIVWRDKGWRTLMGEMASSENAYHPFVMEQERGEAR